MVFLIYNSPFVFSSFIILLAQKRFMFILPFRWWIMQSSMVSPFSVHQQQLAKMLSQQQQFTMATAAGSGNGSHTVPSKSHRPSSNGIHLPAQSWGSYGYQVPGMVMPITDSQKYMQVELLNVNPIFFLFEKLHLSSIVVFLHQMGSSQQVYSAGNPINFPISR